MLVFAVSDLFNNIYCHKLYLPDLFCQILCQYYLYHFWSLISLISKLLYHQLNYLHHLQLLSLYHSVLYFNRMLYLSIVVFPVFSSLLSSIFLICQIIFFIILFSVYIFTYWMVRIVLIYIQHWSYTHLLQFIFGTVICNDRGNFEKSPCKPKILLLFNIFT